MSGRIQLDGALALVTGAGRGIGRATALALAAKGTRVLCADLDADTAADTAAACATRTAGAEAHGLDTADGAAVEALADQVNEQFGALDLLVNNAGVGMSGRFLDMQPGDWDWIRGVNLDGVWNGCRAFGPAMVARGRGHVVNLSSGLGYTPRATEPAYVTTKAAVLALSQCLRADWGASGVGVTAVCPGVINTPIIDHTRFLGAEATDRNVERTKKVFRRGHPPTAVADAIVTAVERDRAVATVGIEAKLGWAIHRLAPLAVQQAIARQAPR